MPAISESWLGEAHLIQGCCDLALDLHHPRSRLPGVKWYSAFLLGLWRRRRGLHGQYKHPQAHRHQGTVGHHHVDQQPQEGCPDILQEAVVQPVRN